MLKLTKKADYGLIAARHLAEHADLGACSAKDLAEMYGIPQEALAKILQRLVRSKLLISQHGTNGGYVLSRDPRTISVLEVVRAIEGPLFITSCKSEKGCSTSLKCTVREPLQKVSRTIEEVLGRLSVWELRESGEDSERLVPLAASGTPHSPTAALPPGTRQETALRPQALGGCGPAAGCEPAADPTQANRRLEWATREEDELVRIEVQGNVSGGSYGK
jgi:Rrf2 family protein